VAVAEPQEIPFGVTARAVRVDADFEAEELRLADRPPDQVGLEGAVEVNERAGDRGDRDGVAGGGAAG
jgi:hypothetical protein